MIKYIIAVTVDNELLYLDVLCSTLQQAKEKAEMLKKVMDFKVLIYKIDLNNIDMWKMEEF